MVALMEGADIRQALSLTWLGAAAVGAVGAGLALILATAGRVFIARAREQARRLARSHAAPGPAPQGDDAALAAAIAVALAAAEESGGRSLVRGADGTGPRTAWALYGRGRLMNNHPARQGR